MSVDTPSDVTRSSPSHAAPGRRRRRRGRAFAATWLAAWLGLIAWKLDVLDSPPYWDAAMGLFVEAGFLADTHFDYRRLVSHEARFSTGGAAIYIISYLPTLLALLMTALPTATAAIVAYRLFNLAAGGLIVALVIELLRPRIGLAAAVLVAIALVSVPLFSVQLDLLSMDLPMAAAAMLAAWLISRRRYVGATAASLAAFFAKVSGGLLAPALAGLLVLKLAAGAATGAGARRLWIGLAASLFATAVQFGASTWVAGLQGSQGEDRETPQIFDASAGLPILAEVRVLCPDVMLLFIASLSATAVAVAGRGVRKWRSTPPAPPAVRLKNTLARLVALNPFLIWGWTIVLATVVLLAFIYTIPRYLTMPLAMLAVLTGWLAFVQPGRRTWAGAAALVLIVFNLANSHGRFFPAIDIAGTAPQDRRNGAQLERSREYLLDHASNQAAVDWLVAHAGEARIVAGNPLVHLLSLPRLGYVERPLAGYALNAFSTPAFPPIRRLRDDPPGRLIFVHVDNRFASITSCPVPRAADDDEILFRDDLDSPLVIFRWKESEPLDDSRRRALAVRRIWTRPRLLGEVSKHIAAGEQMAAAAILEELLRADPEDLEARFLLADVLAKVGQPELALAHLEVIESRAPHDATVHMLAASVLLSQGRIDEAISRLAESIHDPLREPAARLMLAAALLRQDRLGEAKLQLERLLILEPKQADGYFYLALIAARQSDSAEAVQLYRRVLALDPTRIDAANNLAWLLATDGDPQVRNGAEAVAIARQVCQATRYSQPTHLDTLAAALAETHAFDEALELAGRARQLAQQAGKDELVRKLDDRIARYRAGKPHREPPAANPGDA